jgi:hypothetical protein
MGGPPMSPIFNAANQYAEHGRAAHATELDDLEFPRRPIRVIFQILVGLLIVTAIVLPWIILVNRHAPDFLPAMIHEGKQHALEGKEGHHFPPGYYLLLVWPMLMPWSLLLPMAIGLAIKDRKLPQVRFALATVVGPWLMLEFIGTKLPHYLLPIFPALAFLVAYAIRDCLTAAKGASRPNGLGAKAFLVGASFWAFAIVGVVTVPWLTAGPWLAKLGMTLFGFATAASVLIFLPRRNSFIAFASMGIGMLAIVGVASTLYFPNAGMFRISTHVADVLQSVGATHPGDVKMVGYLEPSLAFYQGGTIREVEKHRDLVSKPVDRWPQWVVMSREVWNMLPPETKSRLMIIDTCRGWAYSEGIRIKEVLVVKNTVYSKQ